MFLSASVIYQAQKLLSKGCDLPDVTAIEYIQTRILCGNTEGLTGNQPLSNKETKTGEKKNASAQISLNRVFPSVTTC